MAYTSIRRLPAMADDLDTPKEPGWYPDPFSATGSGERYWDGTKWGTSERPLGRHSTVLEMPTGRDRRKRTKAGRNGDSGEPSSNSRRFKIIAGFIVVVVAAAYVVPLLSGSSDEKKETSSTTPTIAPDRPPPSAEQAP